MSSMVTDLPEVVSRNFSSFEEMKAISLIEQKNTQEAIKLFQNISSDFNIHPGVRRNAIEIMNSIKP